MKRSVGECHTPTRDKKAQLCVCPGAGDGSKGGTVWQQMQIMQQNCFAMLQSFFRQVGEQTPALSGQMETSARNYEHAADQVESDANGECVPPNDGESGN